VNYNSAPPDFSNFKVIAKVSPKKYPKRPGRLYISHFEADDLSYANPEADGIIDRYSGTSKTKILL
jgi:hypothetical protein